MTRKQQTTIQTLVDMLEDNLSIDFRQPPPHADQLRSCALESVMEQNCRTIQSHLEEIGQFVKIKLASIEELTRLNAELKARQAMILKEGERPTVSTETRPPKPNKAR